MNSGRMMRENKAKWPELYCHAANCMWRVKSGPCPKHGERSEAGASRHCTGAAAVESPSREASTPVGSPAPLLAPVGLPDSRPHPADCDCPKCVMPF